MPYLKHHFSETRMELKLNAFHTETERCQVQVSVKPHLSGLPAVTAGHK